MDWIHAFSRSSGEREACLIAGDCLKRIGLPKAGRW